MVRGGEVTRRCLVQQCPRPAVAKGLCDAHRKQLARTGSVEVARVRGMPGEQLPWRLAPYLADLIRHAAEVDGVDAAKWTEAVLLAALCQERYSE